MRDRAYYNEFDPFAAAWLRELIRDGLGDAEQPGLEGLAGDERDGDKPGRERADQGGSIAPASPWADAVWLPCRDGKARPTQPGIFPLAHGVPNRVGTLRGAGNAIVPQCAQAFIKAYMSARP